MKRFREWLILAYLVLGILVFILVLASALYRLSQ